MPCKYVSENERYVISHLAISGYSIKTIAGRINRNYTTFGRELGQLDGAILEDTIYFQENGRKWGQRWFHNNLIKFI